MLDFLTTHTPLLYFTQSLWRDEVFSIFVARRPIADFLGHLTFEPPLYYIILHFWMGVFGTSEMATRSLSFVAFMLATVLVIYHAERRFGHHWLSWFTPVFFFFNPMLLYYAFEVRTYGWYIFFATLAFISYLEKRWKWFTVASVLGFYTHAYMIIVPCTALVHYVYTNWAPLRKNFFQAMRTDPMIRSLLAFFLLISPWLILILREASKLKSSWYFPVDFNLIRSVLGNMFVGYEGTPWFGWPLTAALSKLLLLIFLFTLLVKKNRTTNLFYFLMAVLPLAVVIGISFIKPLFVNRYLIPVTIAEVFLVIGAIQAVPQKSLQVLFAAAAFLLVTGVNIWYPAQHPKTPSRDAMAQINALWDKDDVVYAASPLVLFEAEYYSSDPDRVYLYNPTGYAFPWYVGDFIVRPDHIASTLPIYPRRAFMLHDNATYDVSYRLMAGETPAPTVTR